MLIVFENSVSLAERGNLVVAGGLIHLHS